MTEENDAADQHELTPLKNPVKAKEELILLWLPFTHAMEKDVIYGDIRLLPEETGKIYNIKNCIPMSKNRKRYQF